MCAYSLCQTVRFASENEIWIPVTPASRDQRQKLERLCNGTITAKRGDAAEEDNSNIHFHRR